MQPAQQSPRLRVGWWLIIGGFAALVLSLILLATRTDLESMWGTPPTKRNLAVLEGQNSTVIHLSAGITISSFVEDTIDDPEVSIISPSGQPLATVQENVAPLFNKSTIVQYRQTSAWYIAEEGEYTLISNTSSEQIWFVDLAPIIDEQGNSRDSAMMSMCMLGMCLIPIGFIVLLVSRGHSSKQSSSTAQMMMQTDDGRWIPVVMQQQPDQQVQVGVALPTTDDIYAAYHGHAKSDPIASDPDAHSAIRTTSVPDPFIGEKKATSEMETAPDVQIVATPEPTTVQNTTQHTTIQDSVITGDVGGAEEKDASDEKGEGAWKVWDDG